MIVFALLAPILVVLGHPPLVVQESGQQHVVYDDVKGLFVYAFVLIPQTQMLHHQFQSNWV